MTIDSSGNVFVADDGPSVREYKSASKEELTWDSGTKVTALAIDGKGNLLIAHEAEIDVVYVNTVSEGTDRTALPLGIVDTVTGVIAGPTGEIYFTTSGDSSVWRYNPASNSLDTLATNIFEPRGVAIDNADHLYVTGNASRQVIRIDPGTKSQTALPLTSVDSFAVDAAGDIFAVSDAAIERLTAGSSQSDKISIPDLTYPSVVTVGPKGDLFVANLDGKVVSVRTP
jgi:serine/threonine-protein kinase